MADTVGSGESVSWRLLLQIIVIDKRLLLEIDLQCSVIIIIDFESAIVSKVIVNLTFSTLYLHLIG